MSDVKDLLQRALSDGNLDNSGGAGDLHLSDPAADLARGRTRLHRQRVARLGGATAAVLLVGAVVPVALSGLGDHGTTQAGPIRPLSTASAGPRSSAAPTAATSSKSPTVKLDSIALVSYTGKQPQGYTVDWMPKGWEIQGGNPTALIIAPKDAKDQDPDSFIGKLVVLSQSEGVAPDTSGTAQTVAGRPGYLKVEDDVQILTYKSATKMWVVIQAPTSLGWDGAQIAKFASGVTVLGTAQPGLG